MMMMMMKGKEKGRWDDGSSIRENSLATSPPTKIHTQQN